MFAYLIRWLSRYQLLGFAAIFAIVVICFEGVAGLGLPALFWCRPNEFALIPIGFVVAGFFALCSFVGFLLDHEKLQLAADPVGLKRYFWRTFWLPTVLVAVRGVWRQFTDDRCGFEWVMLIGYALGVAFVWLIAPLLAKAAKPLAAWSPFQSLVNWLAAKGNQAMPAPPDLWLHAYALLVMTGLGLFYAIAAVFIDTPMVNAAVSISILLGLIVLFYGGLRFFVPRAMLLVILVLIIWIVAANQVPLKHRFERMKDVKRKPIQTKPNDTLIADKDALEAWHKQMAARPPQCGDPARPKLIVIMTSGGGIRASVWTAAVLHALDERDAQCRLGAHIRVITGASGGMVGAGYYVAARSMNAEVTNEALNDVAGDALDNVAKYLALRDVPALFLPWSFPDRGYALEQAWRDKAEPMNRTFAQLRESEIRGAIPSLIYSPASLDDGRQLLISNLQLDYMTRNQIEKNLLSIGAMQFFELFPASQPDVALAARMSASFPWVSSAAELPVEELRRVGDAGYWDNYGGFVTASWLEENRQWLTDHTGGVLVIQVRDSMFGDANRDIATFGSEWVSRAFSELIAPVQGALQTRSRVMHFRNDRAVARAAARFPKDFVRSIEIELPSEVFAPLSWNLTEKTAANIIEEAPRCVNGAMDRVKGWWSTAHPAAQTAPTPESRNATIPMEADRSRAAPSSP